MHSHAISLKIGDVSNGPILMLLEPENSITLSLCVCSYPRRLYKPVDVIQDLIFMHTTPYMASISLGTEMAHNGKRKNQYQNILLRTDWYCNSFNSACLLVNNLYNEIPFLSQQLWLDEQFGLGLVDYASMQTSELTLCINIHCNNQIDLWYSAIFLQSRYIAQSDIFVAKMENS